MSYVFPSGFKLPSIRWGNPLQYLFCWFLITLFIVLSFILTVLFNQGRLDMAMSILQGHLTRDFTPQRQFFAFFCLANTFCLIFSALIAIGSEYGWRGFFFLHLLPLGKKKAALLSGLCWGIWYSPLILVGDYSQGHSLFWIPWSGKDPWYMSDGVYYQHNLLIGFLCKILFCTLLGFILCWIYSLTGNIVMTCFSYAVFEQMVPLGYIMVRDVNVMTGGPEGLIGSGILLLIALILYFFIDWDKFPLFCKD